MARRTRGISDAGDGGNPSGPSSRSGIRFLLEVSRGAEPLISVPLDSGNVLELLSQLPDGEASAVFLRIAAAHPSAEVRRRVAYRDHLPEDVVAALADDGSIDVLRDLVESEAFHAFATLEILRSLIQRDAEIASAIALSCDRYVKVARVELVAALMEHPDPAVHLQLAHKCDGLPANIVRTLREHPDPAVADAARRVR